MALQNISTQFRNLAALSTSLLAIQSSSRSNISSPAIITTQAIKIWNASETGLSKVASSELYGSVSPTMIRKTTLSQEIVFDSGINQTTTHIFIVVLALLVIFALIGNVTLIAVIASVRKLHSKTNLLIIDLAVSDIILALTVVPIDIDKLMKNGFHHNVTTCEFVSTMFFMSLPASALSLSLLTLERYITLKYPLTRLRILTRRRAVGALVVKWVYVIIIASLPAMGWLDQPSSVGYYCNIFFTIEYAIFMVAANFVLPLLIILLANIEILRIANSAAMRIRQSMRRPERRRASLIAVGANLKAAKRIMLLVGLFLLSWLPYIANTIYNIGCEGCSPQFVSWITMTLNYSNATMNPILYGLLNKEVRHEMKKLLRQLSVKCTKTNFDSSFHGDMESACVYSMSMATEKDTTSPKENFHETLL